MNTENSDTIHVPHQSMFRDVHNVSGPHGNIIVWESLYPQDKGDKYRYVITVADCFHKLTLEYFAANGFFAGFGLTKAEAIKNANELQRLSARTTLRPHDPVFQQKCLREWLNVSRYYGIQEPKASDEH